MSRRPTRTIPHPLGPEARSEPLRQPNDRDESSTDADRIEETAPVQREQMERARRDVESDRRDTDCRSMPQGTSPASGRPSGSSAKDRSSCRWRRTRGWASTRRRRCR